MENGFRPATFWATTPGRAETPPPPEKNVLLHQWAYARWDEVVLSILASQMLLCQRWTCSAACSTLWPPTAGSQWTSCPSSLQGLRSRPQRSRSRRPSSSTQGLFKDLQYHRGGSQGFFFPPGPQGGYVFGAEGAENL